MDATVSLKKVLPGWVGACCIGYVAIGAVDWMGGQVLSLLGMTPPGVTFGILLIAHVVGSAVLGWVQWRVLSPLVPGIKGWIAATLIGSAIGMVCNFLLGQALVSSFQNDIVGFLQIFTAGRVLQNGFFLTVSAMISGLLLGVAQWEVLRKWLSGSLGWIGVSVAGAIAGMLCFVLIRQVLGPLNLYFQPFLPLGWLLVALRGAIYGGISGLYLVHLLRSRQVSIQ
jgi:hypothetical protein